MKIQNKKKGVLCLSSLTISREKKTVGAGPASCCRIIPATELGTSLSSFFSSSFPSDFCLSHQLGFSFFSQIFWCWAASCCVIISAIKLGLSHFFVSFLLISLLSPRHPLGFSSFSLIPSFLSAFLNFPINFSKRFHSFGPILKKDTIIDALIFSFLLELDSWTSLLVCGWQGAYASAPK